MTLNKILTWLLLLGCAILFAVGLAILVPKHDKMKKMQDAISSLDGKLALEKAELQRMKEEYRDLHSDPDTVEKIAREKYNLCRNGEIVYRYSPEDLKGGGLVGPVGIEPTTR